MLIGVNLFYFLVSNITSIISTNITKQNLLKQKLRILFGLMIQYNLPIDLIKRAKHSIDEQKNKVDLKKFSEQFGEKIKKDLDYYYFFPILKRFSCLKYLRKDILSNIGNKLRKASFNKSNSIISRYNYLFSWKSNELFVFCFKRNCVDDL